MSDIVKGGIADTDGRLMQGDQILTVNGEDVRNANQEAVAALLKVLVKEKVDKSEELRSRFFESFCFSDRVQTVTEMSVRMNCGSNFKLLEV